MDVYQNYKKYREYVPEYGQWKEQRNLQEAKRLEYIKRNPDLINKDDLQRSKALLHAIDVMDEYSQKNAEDMEVATEMAASQAISFVNYVGIGVGALTMAIPIVRKGLESLYCNRLYRKYCCKFPYYGMGCKNSGWCFSSGSF